MLAMALIAGTPFMDRLAEFLRVFIHKKMSTDPGWRGISVILSDGSVPGEGEHKIMEYIRRQRTEPGYDPQVVAQSVLAYAYTRRAAAAPTLTPLASSEQWGS